MRVAVVLLLGLLVLVTVLEAERRGGRRGSGLDMPDAVMKYVNSLLIAKNLPAGVVAELRTIGETIDALMAGNLGRLGDVLAQRFRAVELQASGEATWAQARHLEVITPRGASLMAP